MSAEDFKEMRARLSKRRRIRLSREGVRRLREKYEGNIIECPICGKQGKLYFRICGQPQARYFYCRHGDDYCYIARIEDIDDLFDHQKPTVEQTTLV